MSLGQSSQRTPLCMFEENVSIRCENAGCALDRTAVNLKDRGNTKIFHSVQKSRAVAHHRQAYCLAT